MKTRKEKGARFWLRKNWQGGLFFSEFALGGSDGVSDAQLLSPGRLTPCELKNGEIRKDAYTFELRPGQRDYHRECLDYGIGSIFLLHYQDRIFGAIGPDVIQYRDIWPFAIWRQIEKHMDVMLLIDAAWLRANTIVDPDTLKDTVVRIPRKPGVKR
jgi:hypothetical protein